jgi:hypothetical protein
MFGYTVKQGFLKTKGWQTFLRACAQIVNFLRKSFSCHGNSEQKNGALESCTIIINYYYIVIVKILQGERKQSS